LAETETFYAAQFQQLAVFRGAMASSPQTRSYEKYAVLPVKRRNHPIRKAALANK
jgi:hypothetical protein